MQLPNPSPTSGPDFDPLATCRELAQLVRLSSELPEGEPETSDPEERILEILSELGQNPDLLSPPEAQHNILREGPSPENPTEALDNQESFFDRIP